ncbi:MAG: AMP-binding protein [Pseudomonadota bacterium]
MPDASGLSHTITSDIAASGSATWIGLFQERVRMNPDAVALDHGGTLTSYGTLMERARHMGGVFKAHGLGRGDRVAILSENCPEFVEAEIAAALTGTILACQNWRLAVPELQHCISLVEPKLVLVSQANREKLDQVDCGGAPVVQIGEELEAAIDAADPADPDPALDPEDGMLILYTSGTTGLPKGALISQRAEVNRMAANLADLVWRTGDAFVSWAPMFHMGSTDQQLATLLAGGTVIVIDGLNPAELCRALESYRMGHFVMLPGAYEAFLDHVRARGGLTVKGVGCCGAMADLVPRQHILELMELLDAPFVNSFGSTETGIPPCSAALIWPETVHDPLSKRQSSLCQLRLLDPDRNDVPDGEPGEVAVRGPTIFSGYWNAPETNAKDFKDGWFRLGDLFRRNPDRTYDFVDRAKYMIKSGGENIYPAEIERVLLADARIADAIIVKAKDERWSEVPVAFVAKEDDALTEADVMNLCRANLAGYKRPREVRFINVDDLPRSTSGKIQRHLMEEWV